MSLRKFGLAVAITTVAMVSALTLNEPASAGRSSGHHGQHGHHKHHGQHGHHKHHGDHGVKKCFHTTDGVRCHYIKSR